MEAKAAVALASLQVRALEGPTFGAEDAGPRTGSKVITEGVAPEPAEEQNASMARATWRCHPRVKSGALSKSGSAGRRAAPW